MSNLVKTHFAQQRAVITGGARGIGLAVAERFLRAGAEVVLWDRDEKALAVAKDILSPLGAVACAPVDVSDAASVKNAAAEISKVHGSVEILVNSAGIVGPNVTAWDYDPGQWRRVIDVNLTGVYLCCAAVIPLMIHGKFGRIVNVSSVAGKEGNPKDSAYSSAKAGVIALTKSIAKEVVQHGILVNCVTPATIETEILSTLSPEHLSYVKSRIPMGRFGTAQEVAALIAWLSSTECSFSTGAAFDISGGRATY